MKGNRAVRFTENEMKLAYNISFQGLSNEEMIRMLGDASRQVSSKIRLLQKKDIFSHAMRRLKEKNEDLGYKITSSTYFRKLEKKGLLGEGSVYRKELLDELNRAVEFLKAETATPAGVAKVRSKNIETLSKQLGHDVSEEYAEEFFKLWDAVQLKTEDEKSSKSLSLVDQLYNADLGSPIVMKATEQLGQQGFSEEQVREFFEGYLKQELDENYLAFEDYLAKYGRITQK